MGQSLSRVFALLNPFVSANATEEENNAEENLSGGENFVRSGSYFGKNFLMGGELYDIAKPETFLFGDNQDLELLGNKPVKFPFDQKGVSDSVGVLFSLINVRRDSVKFTKCDKAGFLRIEFLFDCDAPCSIQIHFCAKEVIEDGETKMMSRFPSLKSSELYHFGAAASQPFNKFVFKPHRYDLKLMHYEGGLYFPVVVELRTTHSTGPQQIQTTMCSIERSTDQSATLILKPLKQKLIANGVVYLIQEIFGIENKDGTIHADENGTECIICMANTRDTIILPCRHLCICNGCAENLRYKLNNCPICRSPFKALLKLRAIPSKGTLGSLETRIRKEALNLIDVINGPSQLPSATQSCFFPLKTSTMAYCKDLEHGNDITVTQLLQPFGSSSGRIEQIELGNIGTFSRKTTAHSSFTHQTKGGTGANKNRRTLVEPRSMRLRQPPPKSSSQQQSTKAIKVGPSEEDDGTPELGTSVFVPGTNEVNISEEKDKA